MASKSILIIGGSGFVGMHLLKALSSLSYEVAVLCKNPEKIKNCSFGKNIRLVKGDVTDYENVEKNIKGKDIILNLASVIQHGRNFDPYVDLEVNCRGQLNVLEARRKHNKNSVFITLGTRSQFGRINEKDMPIGEDYCQRPFSIYGIHKTAAESYCSLYRKSFGIRSLVVRLPQVYGPSMPKVSSHNFIEKFINIAVKDGQFLVYGYGMDVKDVVYIDDVIDLILKIIKSGISDGVFNAGSGKKVKLAYIAEQIIRLCGSGSFRLAPFPDETKEFEMGSFCFEISRTRKAFGWKPKTSLDGGIKKMIEYCRMGK